MRDVVELVKRVPGVISSTFMWLDPGTHIYLHIDDPRVHSARFLLGLRTIAGARMRSGDEVRTIERGRVLGFDSSVLHESINAGVSPRIVWGVEVAFAWAEAPLGAQVVGSGG